VIVILGVQRLQGKMQPVLGPPESGPTELGRESVPLHNGEVQPIGHRVQRIVVVDPVDVDPQELTLPELRDVDVGQVDPPVVPVGVEQPGGDGAQLTRASSAAATTATAATRYWRTSIPRSEVGSASSVRNG
jgi:hypothetical protein